MSQEASTLDPRLILDVVHVTEQAAIACKEHIGRGDEKAADAAAVEAMRSALNALPISGRVVIGEGERDEAPMLFIGEEVGSGGAEIDIALDPLEGTTICAKAMANSLAVLAVAARGNLLNAPDVYMDKIAVGGGLPKGVVSLKKSVAENVESLAGAKGKAVADVMVCLLDRPRHAELLASLRALGCGVKLIGDGDVAGVIATTDPATGVDLYMGSGGAPEGVLAAAALRCIGGQIEGRLLFRNDDERSRAHRWGIEDLDRIYSLEDMASGDVIFSASGVTDGDLVSGVKSHGNQQFTETLVMESATHTSRKIKTTHGAH